MYGLMRALVWVLAIGLISGSIQTQAAGFHVRHVETRIVDEVYMLDARLDLKLSDAALEALHNGVPLSIVIEIRVLRARPYWLDEQIARLTQRYRLDHHALSGRYLLVNVNTGASQAYDSLPDALLALGTIDDYPLIDQGLLDTREAYKGTLRAKLDIEKLPAPMRPLAYLSSQWRLSSNRYRWSLQH